MILLQAYSQFQSTELYLHTANVVLQRRKHLDEILKSVVKTQKRGRHTTLAGF